MGCLTDGLTVTVMAALSVAGLALTLLAQISRQGIAQ
jgi:hypothetical protein